MHGADAPAQHAAAHREMLDEVGDLEQRALHRSWRAHQFRRAPARPRSDRRRLPAAAGIRRGSARSRARSAARRRSPAAGCVSDGTMPGISVSRASVWRRTRSPPASRRAARACRDAAGSANSSSTVASSTFGRHTSRRRAARSRATTPRSCVIRISAGAERLAADRDQRQDLRLDRHVERGGRLVGDQQRRLARQRHRDHRRAAACRRKAGADSPARAARGSGMRTRPQHLDRACSRACSASALVQRASPRRSGRRSSCTGLSEVIGS